MKVFVIFLFNSHLFCVFAGVLGLLLFISAFYWQTSLIRAKNYKLNNLVDQQIEEIKIANRLSQSYLESIPGNLLVINDQFDIKYFNKLFIKTAKLFLKNIQVTNLKQFPEENELSPFVRKLELCIQRVFQDGLEEEFEASLKKIDSELHYYSVKIKLVRKQEHTNKNCMVLLRNITKSKRAEQSLKQSETIFRSYFETSPVGIIYLFDPEKPISNCNSQFTDMLGYSKEEILTKTMMELTYAEDLEKDVEEYINASLNGNKYLLIPRKRLQHKDGSIIVTETHLTFVFNEEKELEYIFALVTDITQKLLDQKSLEETRNQLIQSDKLASLGQLTAGVAHEINNPINFISNGVKGLKYSISAYIKDPNDPKSKELIKDINEMITAIEDGSSRTANIVKSLRLFSREDTEHYIETDIILGLESTITLLSNKLKNGIFLEREYEMDAVFIHCYPGQLNQLFMNVMLNAIHAVEGSGTIRIVVGRKEERVIIKIIDNGVGIPSQHKHKVFEPFYTTKSIKDGTGLGLSISFGIVKKHQGQIKVEDNTPKGTQVIISLPYIVSELNT